MTDIPAGAIPVESAPSEEPVQPPPGAIPVDPGIPDQDKYGSGLEMAKTALEQGLSGATLGLSKVAETKLLGVNPEDIAGRESANPGISTAANIGGTLALLGSTGGLGGIAEGAGALGRIAVAGLEGAGIAGINQATDDWSQNKALDAQKIAGSAGLGALLGLGGASLVEGIRASGPALSKSLDFVRDLAEKHADGDSYVSKLAKSFLASGEEGDAFVNKAAEHLTNIHDAVQSAEEAAAPGGERMIFDPFKKEYIKAPSPNLPAQTAAVRSEMGSVFDPFRKEFIKGKVVNPTSIRDVLENLGNPEAEPRVQALESFLKDGVDTAKNIHTTQSYEKGLEELESQVRRTKAFPDKEAILEQIKKAKNDKHAGLGLFAAIEALPAPIRAPLLVLHRYGGPSGAFVAGSDLGKSARMARALANNVESISDVIGTKIDALFGSAASEARKVGP